MGYSESVWGGELEALYGKGEVLVNVREEVRSSGVVRLRNFGVIVWL